MPSIYVQLKALFALNVNILITFRDISNVSHIIWFTVKKAVAIILFFQKNILSIWNKTVVDKALFWN